MYAVKMVLFWLGRSTLRGFLRKGRYGWCRERYDCMARWTTRTSFVFGKRCSTATFSISSSIMPKRATYSTTRTPRVSSLNLRHSNTSHKPSKQCASYTPTTLSTAISKYFLLYSALEPPPGCRVQHKALRLRLVGRGQSPQAHHLLWHLRIHGSRNAIQRGVRLPSGCVGSRGSAVRNATRMRSLQR